MDPRQDKNLFLETDLALHEHCQNCIVVSIASRCQRHGCQIISCPQECGRRFHSCKTEEHLLLCPLVKSPCINACYGCPLWMSRRDLGRHLTTCPASIVYCNMERNRKPIREFGKKLKRQDGRIVDRQFLIDAELSEKDLSDGIDQSIYQFSDQSIDQSNNQSIGQSSDQQTNRATDQSTQSIDQSINPAIDQLIDTANNHIALDLALAYSDQRQINNLYRLPRSRRKSATNFFNKRHPALPLLSKNQFSPIPDYDIEAKSYPSDEGDSSDDENLARKRNASIMSPVARECILCKIDPSSQHLHQLRGETILDLVDNIELDENANESSNSLPSGRKKKPWVVSTSKNVSFYNDRRLMIDLSPDFLPTHYPKCGSYYTIVCDQSMRRDEYARHFANFHNDIVDGLDGWALLRCPLWRYGCGCYATRLEPADGHRKIVYNRWRDAFAVRFLDPNRSIDVDRSIDSDQSINRSIDIDRKSFLDLPFDIICLVCSMLDPGSLFCLAGACRSLNDFVRFSLLPTRGLVERPWIKTESKTGGGRVRWIQGSKRWRLSKSFEPIQKWRLKSTGKFIDHIQKCQYYEPLVHQQERIPVLTFAKPFLTRPSRRDMYRAVALDDHGQEVWGF